MSGSTEFHNRLVFLKQDMSDAAFARKCDVRYTTLKGYLDGKTPGLDNAAKIAAAFGRSLDWLYGNTAIDDTPGGAAEGGSEIIRQAGLLATAIADKSDRIDIDPEEFGRLFREILEHTIRKQATAEQVDTVVDFQFHRSLKR